MFSPRCLVAAIVFASILGACGSANEPDAPRVARIALRLGNVELDSFILRRDVEAQLSVASFDQTGNAVAGLVPSFISRAPNTVSVSNSGLVRGLEPGRTWIVALVVAGGAELRDSMEIFVPEFP